jgi:hypothetical protein
MMIAFVVLTVAVWAMTYKKVTQGIGRTRYCSACSQPARTRVRPHRFWQAAFLVFRNDKDEKTQPSP